MRYLLAAVGRSRPGPERGLFEHYLRRLAAPLVLKEVEEKRPLPIAARIAREGALLLAEVPGGAAVVVLDETGASVDSEALAGLVQGWRDQGRPVVAFLVGGADGHDDAVRKRADLVLSLGRMTWPHMLVRALITEQIYRCECILANHPYHRRRAGAMLETKSINCLPD